MTHYLISFPTGVMEVPDGEWDTVAEEAHQVIRDAKAAGVYVFGGGMNEEVEPVQVSVDGSVAAGGYPQFAGLDGGHTVLKLDSRAEALEWAARIARACRCPQEVREFMFDPES